MYEHRPRCETCGHWWREPVSPKNEELSSGECREKPPTVHLVELDPRDGIVPVSYFPTVNEWEGCSQHTDYYCFLSTQERIVPT